MLSEVLLVAGFVLIGGIHLFWKSDESLTVRLEFMTDKGKIFFCTKKYNSWDDFDFAQEQLELIATDLEKNMHLRELNVTGISLTEIVSEREIFYIRLKKDP